MSQRDSAQDNGKVIRPDYSARASSLSSHSAKCLHFVRSVDSPIFSATTGPADTLLPSYCGISLIMRFDGAVSGLSLISSGESNLETAATSR